MRLYASLENEELIAYAQASHLYEHPLVRELCDRIVVLQAANDEFASSVSPDALISMGVE